MSDGMTDTRSNGMVHPVPCAKHGDTAETLCAAELRRRHENTGSWRAVAESLGNRYSNAYLWMVANGRRTPGRALCNALGVEVEPTAYVRAMRFDTADEVARYDEWRAANNYTRRDVARWWMEVTG